MPAMSEYEQGLYKEMLPTLTSQVNKGVEWATSNV